MHGSIGNRAVSVPLLLLGGMAAVLLHLFAQEESVFYLMTGMSVGIALLLYSLVTHESIGYGDGCLFVMTGLFLGIWENLVLLLLASVFSGNRLGSVAFFLEKRRKRKEYRLYHLYLRRMFYCYFDGRSGLCGEVFQ